MHVGRVAPAVRISASTRRPSSSRTSPKTTWAPSRANSFASAAPCPRAPPLISATFPSSLPMAHPSSHLVIAEIMHTYSRGSGTQRLLGIPVQRTYACKTRGEEQWHCPPRGEADVDNADSMPCHDELPCACEAVLASNLCVPLPSSLPTTPHGFHIQEASRRVSMQSMPSLVESRHPPVNPPCPNGRRPGCYTSSRCW